MILSLDDLKYIFLQIMNKNLFLTLISPIKFLLYTRNLLQKLFLRLL